MLNKKVKFQLVDIEQTLPSMVSSKGVRDNKQTCNCGGRGVEKRVSDSVREMEKQKIDNCRRIMKQRYEMNKLITSMSGSKLH